MVDYRQTRFQVEIPGDGFRFCVITRYAIILLDFESLISVETGSKNRAEETRIHFNEIQSVW